jgi:single-strand DNA-binding protein
VERAAAGGWGLGGGERVARRFGATGARAGSASRTVRAMGLEISGRLHAIFDTAQVSERFTKREFVLELTENPKYPQLVQFQLTGDRVGQLDQFKVGDEVTLEFSLRGREWKSPRGETKYFNSLDVWRIEPGRNVMAGGGGRGGGGGRRDDARGGGGGGDPRGGGGGGMGGRGATPARGRDPREGDAPPPLSDDDRPYGGGSRDVDDDLPF